MFNLSAINLVTIKRINQRTWLSLSPHHVIILFPQFGLLKLNRNVNELYNFLVLKKINFLI